eukprot:3454645-Pyramimonas_sp.AAC.1
MPPTGGWSIPCSRASDVVLGCPTRSSEHHQAELAPPSTPATTAPHSPPRIAMRRQTPLEVATGSHHSASATDCADAPDSKPHRL